MRHPGLIANMLVVMILVGSAASARAQAPAGPVGQSSFHLLETTITDVHEAFRSGQLTCRRLVELYLDRIEAYDKAGPRLNAVQTVNPRALEEAERLDGTYRASGPTGPLHCIPVLVKDQIETSDMPTTYGSVVFQEFVPLQDATVVSKLKQAGAIILGKTTMGEFAAGYTGSAFGIVRNAYDPERNPSGSSGGTGSGIAANFAAVGIGEDTGGSIRGPSAVAGLVGLRPTVPLVSRHGMMPARPTSDTLGPMTRTVRDAALLLDVIAGYDPNDPITAYAVGQVAETYTEFLDPSGLQGARIGVIREPMDPTADPTSEDYQKVKAVMDRAIGDLRSLGATVLDPVTIPELQDRMQRGYQNNVFEVEEAMNDYLAEHPNAPVKTLREILLTGEVVPRRVSQLLGNVGRTTSEPGYLELLMVREETRRIVLQLMADNELDALLYASFDHQPGPIAPDVLTNPSTQDPYRRGWNRHLSPALGFPAMTVPAGFTTDGLPVGMEILARPFAEGTLFRLAYAYEQGTQHRRPPGTTPALEEEP